MNLDRYGNIARVAVSLLVIAGFFAALAALISLSLRDKDFPPGIKETVLVLFGVLTAAFKDVTSYWLGTSHGSSRKTDIMAAGPTSPPGDVR